MVEKVIFLRRVTQRQEHGGRWIDGYSIRYFVGVSRASVTGDRVFVLTPTVCGVVRWFLMYRLCLEVPHGGWCRLSEMHQLFHRGTDTPSRGGFCGAFWAHRFGWDLRLVIFD